MINVICRYKCLVLLVLMSVGNTALTGQDDILYDLDAYRQVDFRLDQLRINPRGGFQASDAINVTGASLSWLPNIDLSAMYTSLQNNAKKQRSSIHQLSTSVLDGYSAALSSDMTTRYYGSGYEDDFYMLYGQDASITYRQQENSLFGLPNSELVIDVEARGGFGFGRMEYINHAWMATLIYDALKDKGLLLRMPSVEEITAFADVLGRVRTNRILDFRMRNIEILETIIAHLRKHKFIDEASATAILIIQDTYQYDEVIVRRTGSRLEFTMAPHLRHSNRKSSGQEDAFTQTSYGTVGTITYQQETNADVKWSQSKIYEARLSISQFNQNGNLNTPTRSDLTIEASMSYDLLYAYTPGARTNLYYGLRSELALHYIKTRTNSNFDGPMISLTPFLSYNYFFSPTTAASVKGELRYTDMSFQHGRFQPLITGTASFSIIHAIF